MSELRRWFQKLLYKSGLVGKTPEDGEKHASAETAYVPRIESIQGLGKLEHDPEFERWQSQPVKVNLLDGKLLNWHTQTQCIFMPFYRLGRNAPELLFLSFNQQSAGIA